jgi:hypothetical protein
MTDVIDMFSKSGALIEFLNHMGLCVSKDTLDRHVRSVGEAVLKAGPLAQKPKQLDRFFDFVHIDNVDVKADFCGSSARRQKVPIPMGQLCNMLSLSLPKCYLPQPSIRTG